MVKKILITAFVIIAILSITLNVLIISNNGRTFMFGERQRLDEAFSRLIHFEVNEREHKEFINLLVGNKDLINTDPYLRQSIKTLNMLTEIQDNIITISGGIIPETWKLYDSYGVDRVNNLFYSDNNWHPHASEYFNESINNYLQVAKKHDIISELDNSVQLIQKNSELPLFENMTVSESYILLELIGHHIIIETIYYITVKNK